MCYLIPFGVGVGAVAAADAAHGLSVLSLQMFVCCFMSVQPLKRACIFAYVPVGKSFSSCDMLLNSLFISLSSAFDFWQNR